MNIVLFLSHPCSDSFGHAIANAYQHGARAAGANVHLVWLDELRFDPLLHVRSPRDQELEPALKDAKHLIAWADHLVFVFPTWWATMPALLKGFFDRILLPGFAFEVDESAPSGYRPLLTGKSAQLITTMDTPQWVYRLIYGRPGERALRRGILGFCGIKPVHVLRVCRVKHLSAAQRQGQLTRVQRVGHLAAQHRRHLRVTSWLQAMRLPFQGMTLCSYGLGAAAACQLDGASPPWARLATGWALLTSVAVASVFVNEVYDQGTDRRNRNAGPFTGGSRVLIDHRLSERTLLRGAHSLLALAGVLTLILLLSGSPPVRWAESVLLVIALIAGPGYTAPPSGLSTEVGGNSMWPSPIPC